MNEMPRLNAEVRGFAVADLSLRVELIRAALRCTRAYALEREM